MSLAGGIQDIRTKKDGGGVIAGIHEAARYLPYISSGTSQEDYMSAEQEMNGERAFTGYRETYMHRYRLYGLGTADIYIHAVFDMAADVYVSKFKFDELKAIFNGMAANFISVKGTLLMEITNGGNVVRRVVSIGYEFDISVNETYQAGTTVAFYGIATIPCGYTEGPRRQDIDAATGTIEGAVYGPELKKGLISLLQTLQDAGAVALEEETTGSDTLSSYSRQCSRYRKKDSNNVEMENVYIKYTFTGSVASMNAFSTPTALSVKLTEERVFPAIVKRSGPGGTSYAVGRAEIIQSDTTYTNTVIRLAEPMTGFLSGDIVEIHTTLLFALK